MKDIYISVQSGLNNKLIPLLSLLRISYKENCNIKCFWSNICVSMIKVEENGYHFLDLFESIDKITFINENEYKHIKNSKNVITHNTIYSSKDDVTQARRKESLFYPSDKIHIFNNICHLISYTSDNVCNKYISYPTKTITKCNFVTDFRKYLKMLKPKKDIQILIDNISKQFNGKKVLGLHFRNSDGPYANLNVDNVIKFIDIFLEKNKDWYIYLSCDTLSSETKILSHFNKIFYLNTPLGKSYKDKFNLNSKYGLQNSVCDMFILSKCNKIVGTPSSSYSVMSWFLSNTDKLEYWY